jgi:predicted ATPase/serine/threonine protein kinase
VSHPWSRIEQLFHEALARTETDRSDFLDRACEGDLSLRNEVEALLESDLRATGFLSAPIVIGAHPAVSDAIDHHPSAPDQPTRATPPQFEFVTGTMVGNYRIVRPLGRGGMGEVYEAEDLTLGRHVAIKLLKVVSDSTAARARLLSEARTASSLNHPHIVTVHSIERDRDGRDFLVMEFVEGSTMRERLTSGGLEIDELLSIAAQVADALAAAHARGIVHRDLKPENVMFTATGSVKLLDFGIAAHARSEEDLETHTGAPAAIVGTVSYMSPEQAGGGQIDFRSDQFSLGSILYETATGERLFRGASAAQTLAAVRRAAVPSLTERCPLMPDPLRWIIERCLCREPGDRYASTNDLHRELAMVRTRLFEIQATDDVPSVPLPRTPLVGRASELTTVTRLVDSGARLMTLTGPGGVGKTRLALELAATLSGRFGNRVFFVDLSPVHGADAVGKTIASALGVRDTTDTNVVSALRRWIRERQQSPMLLVIDNFEHVLDAAPLVSELLAAGKSLIVLATSRAVLRLAGEYDVMVPPLDVPDTRHTTLEQLSSSAAVTLFVQRATAAKSDFILTEENAGPIARICQRLDGLPLAIELAAARVRLLSPAAILSRLERRLDVLTGGPRDAPQRQKSFRAALEWSEELLDASERMLFRRMAVFSGGCTAEGVEAVCNVLADLGESVEDLLDGLVQQNMLVVVNDSDPHRVSQLETIREYAQERLAASNDGELARRAHAAYCVVLAEEGYGLRGREQSQWMRRCDVEYANYRAAHEWLIEKEQFAWGVRLASALIPFWEARALLTEGREWMHRLLQLPRAAQDPVWRAKALMHSAFLIHLQGDMAAWMPISAETEEAVSKLEDRHYLAQHTVSCGVVLAQLGRHDEARAQIDGGIALWREIGDVRGEARAFANLATLAKITGDNDRARQLCQYSRELFVQCGDRDGVAWSFNHEADAARWAGDLATAQQLLTVALEQFRAAEDDAGAATCLADLATISVAEDPSTAEQHALEALRVLMITGHSREIAHVLETLARVAWHQEAPERALRLAGAVAAIKRKFGRYDRLELRHPAHALDLQDVITKSQERAGSRAATCWMEGWTAPLAETVEYALATRPA